MKIDWTAELIAEQSCGTIISKGNLPITGFSTDSRSIKPGNVYFALSGENFNGHQFIKSAFENGAVGVVVSEDIDPVKSGFVIRVKDCLTALQNCALFYRRQHQGFFIGVTGSNGKTTTRSMLAHLLSEDHICASTTGNLNNHIGLPLTILSVPAEAQFIVLEMGMNHAGEIRDLCRIAHPNAALVSNIGPAHIGILGSLENIARAKAEIFEAMKPDSIKIAPADTQFNELFKMVAGKDLKTFGESESAEFRVKNIIPAIDQVSFDFISMSENCSCSLPMSGRHNALNAAAALSLYQMLGFSAVKGARRLQSFSAVSARMERVNRNGINILLDCYNANPGSMKEALSYLNVCPRPCIAVLGDMRELGEMSAQLHREIGALAAELFPDVLLTVGEEAKHIAQAASENKKQNFIISSVSTCDEAVPILKENLKPGATVLFKASRGMHFEKIVRKIWPDLAEGLH
ncbi:MAG: UDP-N-acetylmuramoyl-tripeptide--D-alanyl-D-alanine ligase [Candidatus Riflebacteria bacterium]